MMKSNSLFGLGAKHYSNDARLGIQFLRECHDHIILHEKIMINHLGNRIVKVLKNSLKMLMKAQNIKYCLKIKRLEMLPI